MKPDYDPCPKCAQRVVLPGVGVETHLCANPADLRRFFDAIERHVADCDEQCDGRCVSPVYRDNLLIAAPLRVLDNGDLEIAE